MSDAEVQWQAKHETITLPKSGLPVRNGGTSLYWPFSAAGRPPTLHCRGVHGNGIPMGFGIENTFPWEWEWE